MPRYGGMLEEIERVFVYYPPANEGQIQRYNLIRSEAMKLAELIDGAVPDSKEKSVAVRKIREAVMYANAGIAIVEGKGGGEVRPGNGHDVGSPRPAES